MAKTTVPGLYIADGAITAAKLSSTLDLSGVTITVATASTGDNDTTVASTAFVQQEIAALVDSSPSALNTLNELAAAIGDDASFSTTVTNSIATKLALAGGTMTGDLIINTTGSIQIPVGTTAQRPTAAQGQLRFNTTTSKPEIYNGSAWADVGGGVESVNSATGVVTLDTDDISEGSTNLYFTNARADARIAAADTDDLSEGSTNLYFTTARANSAIDGRLSGSTGVTVSNGAISIGQDVATSTSPTFQNLTLSGTDSVKVPSGTTAQRSGSPANGMLRYNSSTNEFEGYANSVWGAIGGDTTSSVDLYTVTGNGSTATYDTGKNPQSENNTWVFIGGVYQPKSTYSFSGTEITLSENLPNGEDLEVITGTVSTYNPTDAILGQYNVTTSNTASYDTSLTTENENNVFVFIDGVYQPKSSYTYSGSTLTLDAVPTSGMSLEVLVTRSMNAATVTTGFLADDAVTTAKITDANVTAAKLASSLDLTGKTVTVATASAGDNDTSVASTAFVRQEITSLVDSAPAAMDTLNELAAALGDDANFSTTVNASIATKLPLAGGTLTGNLVLGDSVKAIFGNGSDLEIFHNGTESFIKDVGTGNLRLQGTDVQIRGGSTAILADFVDGGAVFLRYNNSSKFATTSTGIDVTGTVTADGLTVDGSTTLTGNTSPASDEVLLNLSSINGIGTAGNMLRFTDADPTATNNGSIGKIQFYSEDTDAVVVEIEGQNADASPDGRLILKTAAGTTLQNRINIENNGDISFYEDTGTTAKFFWDASAESLGIGVTNPTATLDVNGTIKLDGNYPTGTENVALGNTALDSLTSGSYNTGIGANAFTALTTGAQNTSLGYAAGQGCTGASSFNVAIGDETMLASGEKSYNTAVGSDALRANTTANSNTAVGYQALTANTTGANHTAIGLSALAANTTGSNNVAVGFSAASSNTTGEDNIAIGVLAFADNTTGSNNVGIGRESLEKNTTASNNTAVGYRSLAVNTTGASNTAVGALSLDANTTGHSNTAVGQASLSSNTTGTESTAVGLAALESNTTGQNTALGFYAGRLNTTGDGNTAIGRYALASNTTGNNNTVMGAVAKQSDGGSNVVAVGYQSQRYATANNNVSVGYYALRTATGADNTAVGKDALKSNSTGANNTAVGSRAGESVTTSTKNTIIGYVAGNAVTTGTNNTLVGYATASTSLGLTTGNSNQLFGSQCDTATADTSDAHALGFNLDCTGGYTTLGKSTLDIRAQHGVATWSTVSDERVKKDITDATAGLSFINDLRPVTFNYKNKGDIPEGFKGYEEGSTEPYKFSTTEHGFIAQEVKAVIDNHSEIADGFKMWSERETGQQEVAEAALIPILVKAVQELSSQVDELKAEIQTLKGE
jgi:hypothetical protein